MKTEHQQLQTNFPNACFKIMLLVGENMRLKTQIDADSSYRRYSTHRDSKLRPEEDELKR